MSGERPGDGAGLRQVAERALDVLEEVTQARQHELGRHEIGRIASVESGVARVRGLPGVRSEELVLLPDGLLGLAYNLDVDEIGVVLLGSGPHLAAGGPVRRTGRILDVPVGEQLIGRVVDALGNPLDDLGPLRHAQRSPVERPSPPILHRAPVNQPLQTGLKVIDSLLPIGRGQRELILGDRQTGKTAIALDAILNQQGSDVLTVYCAVGQRTSAVAKLLAVLGEHGALAHSIVVVAAGDEPPGLRFVAPFAATTMAEYFMERGRDVLIVYDDLTAHARAYRELSLLLRRPPGREAYPGDIFYLHARLLERSTRLRPEYGGGSLTALPIAETQAQNVSAYIPTNLISITDGQIILSPDLFRKGVAPAVDAGRSVSRVGGKAQLPGYQAIAGDLRLSYAQYEELEVFARFGTRLDETSRSLLERGRRVREVLKQPDQQPMPVPDQIAILLAAAEGLLHGVPVDRVGQAEVAVRRAVTSELPEVCDRLVSGEPLTDEDRQALVEVIRAAVVDYEGASGDADA